MSKIIALILIFSASSLRAQEFGDSLSHHQAGISVSTLSGNGLTYAYIFNRDFRIKSTVFAYYEDRNNGGNDWTGSLGLELQFTFESGSMTRFYGILGGNFYHYKDVYQTYNYISDAGNNVIGEDAETEDDFAFGVGAGFELLAWRHLALDLSVTFQFTQTKYNYTNSYPSITRYVGPGGGAEISYRF